MYFSPFSVCTIDGDLLRGPLSCDSSGNGSEVCEFGRREVLPHAYFAERLYLDKKGSRFIMNTSRRYNL